MRDRDTNKNDVFKNYNKQTITAILIFFCLVAQKGISISQQYTLWLKLTMMRPAYVHVLEKDAGQTANSTTIASQAHPVSPSNMSSTSQTTSSNRQAMATKPKLQKALHVPTRNRQMTITPTKAVWPKPLFVSARNNTSSGSFTRTIQSSTAHVLQLNSQSLHNTVNI